MKKPLVGITPDYDATVEEPIYKCHKAYCDAITKAGGIPIILPFIDLDNVKELLSMASGFMLTGGIDFAPELYGGGFHPLIELIDPERDQFEIDTIKYARERDLPMLGICRGMQLMNVLSGGDIYQHTLDSLPDALEHRPDVPFGETVHDIVVEPDSKLGEICSGKYRFAVNSKHHQAVNRVGADYRVSARSDDGVIEAIEDPSASFAIGVEWHPEHMVDAEPVCLDLFRAFVEACAHSHQRRMV